jgi:hypothetical protein
MSAIAKHIIASIEPTLLNWDHTVYPTPTADFILNVQEIVQRHTGWDVVQVTVNNCYLNIKVGRDNISETLLTYDMVSGRQVYGLLAHTGLSCFTQEMKAFYLDLNKIKTV